MQSTQSVENSLKGNVNNAYAVLRVPQNEAYPQENNVQIPLIPRTEESGKTFKNGQTGWFGQIGNFLAAALKHMIAEVNLPDGSVISVLATPTKKGGYFGTAKAIVDGEAYTIQVQIYAAAGQENVYRGQILIFGQKPITAPTATAV